MTPKVFKASVNPFSATNILLLLLLLFLVGFTYLYFNMTYALVALGSVLPVLILFRPSFLIKNGNLIRRAGKATTWQIAVQDITKVEHSKNALLIYYSELDYMRVRTPEPEKMIAVIRDLNANIQVY